MVKQIVLNMAEGEEADRLEKTLLQDGMTYSVAGDIVIFAPNWIDIGYIFRIALAVTEATQEFFETVGESELPS